jgi:hypothetical protein
MLTASPVLPQIYEWTFTEIRTSYERPENNRLIGAEKGVAGIGKPLEVRIPPSVPSHNFPGAPAVRFAAQFDPF